MIFTSMLCIDRPMIVWQARDIYLVGVDLVVDMTLTYAPHGLGHTYGKLVGTSLKYFEYQS